MWVYFWGCFSDYQEEIHPSVLLRGNYFKLKVPDSRQGYSNSEMGSFPAREILKSGHRQGGIWPIFLHSILPPLPGCASKGWIRRTQTIGRNLWRPNLLLFLDNPPLFQTNYSLRTSNVLITILREVSTHKSWCLFGKSPSGWGGERYRKNIVPDFRTYWGLYFTNIRFFKNANINP